MRPAVLLQLFLLICVHAHNVNPWRPGGEPFPHEPHADCGHLVDVCLLPFALLLVVGFTIFTDNHQTLQRNFGPGKDAVQTKMQWFVHTVHMVASPRSCHLLGMSPPLPVLPLCSLNGLQPHWVDIACSEGRSSPILAIWLHPQSSVTFHLDASCIWLGPVGNWR